MAAGAFATALRGGDSGALLAVPGPDDVLVADWTAVQAGAPQEVRGAEAVAGAFSGHAWAAQPAPVNGATIAPWRRRSFTPSSGPRSLSCASAVTGRSARSRGTST